MRRRWIGLGLLRAAEGFRRIKRHAELGALVTALSRRGHRRQKARAPEGLRIELLEGGRYVGIPLRAVN